MDRVLLVIPPLVYTEGENPDPTRPDFELRRLVSPIEPARVAADLRRRGFAVTVLDLGIYYGVWREHLRDRLKTFRPDAVVMAQSILTFATASDWDGAEVFAIARAELPRVLTVLTGNSATNRPGEAVSAGVCDISIRGEIDLAVGEVLESLRYGGDVATLPGVSIKRSDGTVSTSATYPSVDVETLPLPAYDLFDQEHLTRYSEILEVGKIRFPERSPRYRDIMTSRGCTLRCSFCSVAHYRGPRQKRRRLPMAMVLDEIRQALDQGIAEIHFFDDLFANSEREIIDFCEALASSRLRFSWFVAQGMPLWPLTREALAAMVQTGFYRMIAPFESGSNRVLREVVGKIHSTVEQHERVAQWCAELDIELIGMFVIGMPGERRGEILQTLRFAESHPEIDYSVFSIATPMTGTRLMRKVSAQKQLKDPSAIDRVIKRTVALYHTAAFSEYELGIIRAYDWDRINFPTIERQRKYARMVGLTLEQLSILRAHSKQTFHRFFPDYDGPLSFADLYERPGLFELAPNIPASLY